jgi:hypothetical protein
MLRSTLFDNNHFRVLTKTLSKQNGSRRSCLKLETLEDRLTPAAVLMWTGDAEAPTAAAVWSNTNYWDPKAKPGVNDTVVFKSNNAKPYLNRSETIKVFVARSVEGNQGDTITTKLDLKGHELVSKSTLAVYSGRLDPDSDGILLTGPGKAADAVLLLESTGGAGSVQTGSLSVGFAGGEPAAGTYNKAVLTIASNVTVDVKSEGTLGNTSVGKNNMGVLILDGGKLNAKNLLVYGVVGESPLSQSVITVKNNGELALTGTTWLGGQATPAGNKPVLLQVESAKFTTQQLRVGLEGSALLLVRAGGIVEIVEETWVGHTVNNIQGVLDIENGGTVIAKKKLTIQKPGIAYVRAGASLDLREGGENRGRLEVAVNGQLKARGTGVLNKGTISGELGNGGLGKLEIEGDFTQTAEGRLELRLASALQYDHLFVSPLMDEPGGGHVSLDGRLSVQTSFTPTPWMLGGPAGDYFTVVRASNSLTGQFDPLTGLDLPDLTTMTASLPSLPPGQAYAWRVIYDTTDSLDASLASSNPAFANQPWVGNGTKDVVLVLEVVAQPPHPDPIATATIRGRVWLDTHANGIREAGEAGLAGVMVWLYNEATQQIVATAITDANGDYELSQIPPGSAYRLFVSPINLPNALFTLPNQGNDDTVDSDVNAFGFTDDLFALIGGQLLEHLDAGILPNWVDEEPVH